MTIGRSRQCDVVVDDATVSRRHALFSEHDGQWTVEDLGSKNGTAVNGVLVSAPTPLAAGDVVGFGARAIRFAPERLANARR